MTMLKTHTSRALIVASSVFLLWAVACDGDDELQPPGTGGAGSGAGPGAGGAGGAAEECFDGEPVVEKDLLNACTEDGCEPFDNAARLPLLGENGELPELP